MHSGEPADPHSLNRSGDQQASASGPLLGVKVVDFCSFIAGAAGAMLLGDLGAEVIKVEPLTGDLARAWGPFLAGESRYFQGWNRSKRSLAIDLTTGDGREVVYRLIERADVVVENFRPGITEKLQIDYANARRLNPGIIYCSSTAFGSRGPFRLRPAYDPVLQTMAGAARGNLRFSGTIAICSVAVSDYQAAMLAVAGILAALYHRQKTGAGQHLETSLLQAIMSVQAHFEALGATELTDDPKFVTNPQRLLHQVELYARLEPHFLTKSAMEWEKLLVEKEVPCGVVGTYHQFFVHPQVEAMDMNPVVDHPTIGPMRLFGVPIHFEKTPGRIQQAAPTLGQHTDEILRECGYDADKIEALRLKGVIGQAI